MALGDLVIQIETRRLIISTPTPVKVGTIFGAAGGDLAGTHPNPTVAAITETSGPTQLIIDGIPDGELLIRAGATITGVALAAGAPPDVAAAGAVGVSISPARADHTHGHDNLLGGALHAEALPLGAAGFLSGADKSKLDALGGLPGFVKAPGNITTVSVTDVLMTSMTLTPGAGDYLVSFSTTVTNSGNNNTITLSIYVNGVQVTDSERAQVMLNANDGSTVAICNFLITGVGGGEAVEIRWRTTAGTATARDRHMSLLRVGQ